MLVSSSTTWNDAKARVEIEVPMTVLHSNDCADTPFRSGRALAIAGESTERGAAVGASAAWREVLKRAARVAATETTACLQGESGAGKEVIARYMHRMSPRCRGPFVAINCPAVPGPLLEWDLVGCEGGLLSAAVLSRPGQV